ncbi:MAG: DUF2059 domain-containing protein [Candidatus Cloacimonetes bacterium]|nr:DUF2059 domain-containing protein [Candidatus Cloacimonadota bacterium]
MDKMDNALYMKLSIPMIEETFTYEELVQINKFLESPSGKKYIASYGTLPPFFEKASEAAIDNLMRDEDLLKQISIGFEALLRLNK